MSSVPEVSPALEVSCIAKPFNGSRAVDDLSFTVEQGSTYGLLGPWPG